MVNSSLVSPVTVKWTFRICEKKKNMENSKFVFKFDMQLNHLTGRGY